MAEPSVLEELSPEDQDEVINHLVAGRRAVATLLLYRAGNCTLEQAWASMNGLSDNSHFEGPDQDPSFACVAGYLEGPTPRKETCYFLLAAALFLILGAVIVILKWPAFQTGIGSYFWQDAQATIVDVRFSAKSRPSNSGSRRTTYYIDYRYRYHVGSDRCFGAGRRSYLPGWGDLFEVGDSIAIVYNPQRIDESLHDRNMYSRCFGLMLGLLVMAPGLIVLGFGFMFNRINRSLRKCDPLLAGSRRA